MFHWLFISLALSVYTLVASADPTRVKSPGLQCIGMENSVRLPNGLSQLRTFGKLNEEQTVNVHEWDDYKAIEKLLRFNGLYVQVITFTNDPERYKLSALYVEASGWSVSPIRVGSSVKKLHARFRNFTSEPNGTWRFAGESDSVYVEVRNGKVFRVAYECYAD